MHVIENIAGIPEEEFIGSPREVSEIVSAASLNLIHHTSKKPHKICYIRVKEWTSVKYHYVNEKVNYAEICFFHICHEC